MNILAITSYYPHQGRETHAAFNRQQFAALAKEHRIRLIAPIPWTHWLKVRRTPPLNRPPCVNSDGIWVDHPTLYFTPRILESRYGQMYLRSIASAVERSLRDFKADALLTSWAHPDGWAAVQMGRRHGLPVTLKVVGSDLLVVAKRRQRLGWIQQTLAEVDHVVAVSQDLATEAVRLGADPARTSVVYEGVNGQLFSPGDRRIARQLLQIPEDQQALVFVGNLLLSKGAGVLIEAMAQVRRDEPAAHCYMIGAGRDKAKILRTIARVGMRGHVTLVGGRRQEELVDWYRASDLVVLPSFSEGIPNVLREAMMCGRPYVATAVGGIPEITDAAHGRLVPPGDANALARAIETVLKADLRVDPEVTRRHNNSWEESARQLATCMQQSLQRKLAQASAAKPGEQLERGSSPTATRPTGFAACTCDGAKRE